MNHIAFTRPDGGVSVIVPAPKAQLPGESEADFMARVATAVPPDAVDVAELDTLPSRTYRDAWVLSGGKVQHDMVKARQMRLAELRAERDAKLQASDGPYLRAQEQNNAAETNRLKVTRQRLRDLPNDPATTNALGAITDPDALKGWTPSWP